MATFPSKPLGIKNYGHIPHLPGSRMGAATIIATKAKLASQRQHYVIVTIL